QIPKQVNAKTWVHFGTRMVTEVPVDNAELMAKAQAEYKNLTGELSKLPTEEAPNFLQLSYRVHVEEFIFIDSSVRMTQNLVRPNRVLVGVRGEHQGFETRGSLGGMEVLEPP